jgi:hypothetical protein
VPVAGRPRNPLSELPLRFRARPHLSIALEGESPGLSEHDRSTGTLAAGQIRRVWRQTAGAIPGPAPFSWSANGPGITNARGFQITRALRYLTHSVYMRAGNDATRFGALRHYVSPDDRHHVTPSLSAGTRRGMPTLRNRLTSFGSRVTPLNPRVPAASAEESQP